MFTLQELIDSQIENKLNIIVDNYNLAISSIDLHTSQLAELKARQEDDKNPAQEVNVQNLIDMFTTQSTVLLVANPWVVDSNLPKPVITLSEDELAQINATFNSNVKSNREQLVAAIMVTSSLGNSFNGDEVSQTRITRAIVALPDETSTILWTLSNNSKVAVAKPELQEVLLLAGIEQTKLW